MDVVREDLTKVIKDIESLPGSPETTLALRKVQEARMWLGVASAKAQGLDPWVSKVEEK